MAMSHLLTALFVVAAILVAYRIGVQEGLSFSAEGTTVRRGDRSGPGEPAGNGSLRS